MPATPGERLIKLESRIDHIEAETTGRLVEAKEDREEILHKLNKIDFKLSAIDHDLTKYKGIIGGISLVLSGIGVLLVFFKSWVVTRLGIAQ